MIKVLYDYQAFDMQKYGGISRYFANIIKGIEASSEFDYKLAVLVSKNHYLDKIVKPSFMAKLLLGLDAQRESLNKKYSKYCLSKDEFDIFHPTCYHTYFLKYLKKPFVLTVHDMIHERYPAYFQSEDPTILRKGILIRQAAHIIAISEATKKDILEFYPDVKESRITVVHHGHNPMSTTSAAGIGFPRRYILFVGMRIFYKNFYLLLDAFAKIVQKETDLVLLCAGGGNFTKIENDYMRMRGLTSNVKQITFSDDELYYIYRNALFLVNPSLYEGFGLPLLEAFEAECPILLNDTAPFREVAGDAALYCDSSKVADMVDKIQWALSHPNYMSKLIPKGTERLKQFTMTNCMDKTLKVYNSI